MFSGSVSRWLIVHFHCVQRAVKLPFWGNRSHFSGFFSKRSTEIVIFNLIDERLSVLLIR